MGGKGGSGGGPSSTFYDKMMELSQQSQQMGDLYSAIDLNGYRPGDKAHDLQDKYYKTGKYTPTEATVTPEQAAAFEQVKYQGQTYTKDPATGKMYDSSGVEVTNKNAVAHISLLGSNDNEDNNGGRSAINKRSLNPAVTENKGQTGYEENNNLIQTGPFSTPEGQAAIVAASEKTGTMPGYGAKDIQNAPRYGRTITGLDGNNIYTSQTGQRYNASTQGLTQMGTEAMMSLVEPTRDLEYETIQSNREVLPSTTKATISTNDLLTTRNLGAQSLVPKKLEITNKFLDETSKGVNIGQQMDEASTDVASAFAKTNAARDRGMARMGVTPGSGAYQDNSTANARAVVAARGNARRSAQDENYRRLGAVGLSGL